MGKPWDLLELSRHLRQERLCVTQEKEHLQQLHNKVSCLSWRVSHTAWVAHHQRQNLAQLGLQLESPALCVQRSSLIERAKFEEAYKRLTHQEILYCEFLRTLRDKPKLLAQCLTAGDALNWPEMSLVCSTLFSGVYGSCLQAEDEQCVVQLLHHLMESQLLSASNPRKLLRNGNCAFTRLYKAFTEELFSAKLFLTSALYEPILNLLCDDEIFLDIDPSKAVIRFPPKERQEKFGPEGSAQYETAFKEHRQFILAKLEALTNSFISAIRKNLHCFPPSLARLLRSMYSLMMSSGRSDPKEVNAVCVDVIFDLFICPAMVDPNPVGIIDTPISYIARSNLMQVAQILQVLSLWKWESHDIDARLLDLYSRFDKEAMSSILEAILELGEMTEEMHDLQTSTQSEEDGQKMHRLAALLTAQQLDGLVGFFRHVEGADQATLSTSGVDGAQLKALLQPLPAAVPKPSADPNAAAAGGHNNASAEAGSDKSKSQQVKKMLANRISNAANTLSNASKNLKMKPEEPATDEPGVSNEAPAIEGGPAMASTPASLDPEHVLIIPMGENGGGANPLPGFLSEEQVLARSRQASRVVRMNLENLPGNSGGTSTGSGREDSVAGEKRTRFSLSHDGEGSIGNTSDNLEAISEASDCSESSVDEDEVVQADPNNETLLNDLVSANVSGRGTPNVSGRDTPSSQVTEGEELIARAAEADDGPEAAAAAPEGEANPPEEDQVDREEVPHQADRVSVARPAQHSMASRMGRRKTGEPDLEEKFGRFEIKPNPRQGVGPNVSGELGDETVSLVSETWSTDVLASDTETLGEADGTRPQANLEEILRQRNIAEEAARNRLLDEFSVPAGTSSSNLLDVAETASEAWSMDVLASDSESLRLGDLDNEDTASVARSDDTRFTDDTTRSDPDQVLDSASAGNIRAKSRDDVTLNKRFHISDSNRPSRVAAVEQWARQSSGAGKLTALTGPHNLRRGSDSSGAKRADTSILKKTLAPSISAHQQQALLKARSVNPSNTSTQAEEATPDPGANLSTHLSAASIASSSESSAESGEAVKIRTNFTFPSSGVSFESAAKPASMSLLDSDNPTAASSSNVRPVAATSSLPCSTGAIPKSISFDKTVYDQCALPSQFEDGGKANALKGRDKSFFKNWKLPKIGRNRGGGSTGGNSSRSSLSSGKMEYAAELDRPLIDLSDGSSGLEAGPGLSRTASEETPDDILAKYRKKSSASHTDSLPDSTTSGPDALDGSAPLSEEIDERLVIDPLNVEASFAFHDAKRKLRLMLSEADLSTISYLPNQKRTKKKLKSNVVNGDPEANGPDSTISSETDIVVLLRVLLAEAHNLQDRNLVAQLHETLRCISLFDSDGCKKLLRSLKEDYKRRAPYLAYLVRCRQGLLATISHQQRLLSRLEVDQSVCSQYLVSVVIRLFLERKEKQMLQFLREFKECSAADEKIALMEQFLQQLWSQMEEDPRWALVGSDEQLNLGRQCIERSVVSQIYMQAMYPNGEADSSRDEMLSEHMRKLSRVITAQHKDLKIPRQYHYEMPWPSAQEEIKRLAAYKTPSDKVACVLRSCHTIMNLLSMATDGKSVPAADDFMPVMVFVLVKANPPSLLSTVQYVESFYGNRICGEDQYWWMQFVSAIEFIKTMDYRP